MADDYFLEMLLLLLWTLIQECSDAIILMLVMLNMLCLCLTSHQQLRSYGDRATAYSLIRQTGEARDRTCHPWFTRQAVYPVHHSGSCHVKYAMFYIPPKFLSESIFNQSGKQCGS